MTYLFFYPNKLQYLTYGSWYFEVYKIEINNDLFLGFIYSFTTYCYGFFMPIYSILIMQNYTTKSIYFWGIFWGVVDTVFEILQLRTTEDRQIDSIYLWLPDKFNHYIESGSCDAVDIAFLWLGILSAFYLWSIIKDDNI